jgi:hypothetical protein
MFKKIILVLVAVLIFSSIVNFAYSTKKTNKVATNVDSAIKNSEKFECNTGASMGVKNSKMLNLSRPGLRQFAGQCYCPVNVTINGIKHVGGIESLPMQPSNNGLVMVDDKGLCKRLTKDYIRSKTPCIPVCPEGKTCNTDAGVEPMCMQAKTNTKSTALKPNKQKAVRIV